MEMAAFLFAALSPGCPNSKFLANRMCETMLDKNGKTCDLQIGDAPKARLVVLDLQHHLLQHNRSTIVTRALRPSLLIRLSESGNSQLTIG